MQPDPAEAAADAMLHGERARLEARLNDLYAEAECLTGLVGDLCAFVRWQATVKPHVPAIVRSLRAAAVLAEYETLRAPYTAALAALGDGDG